MQSKYCLPIIRNSKSDVISLLREKESDYGYFEIWIDYIEDLDDEFVDDLLEEYEDRLVFIFRRNDMSQPMLKQTKKLEIFNKLKSKKCYVDLDIYHQKEDLKYAENLNLIISYHNYEETPDNGTLDKIVKEIKDFKPAIIKISTMCIKPDDSLRLLRVKRDLLEAEEKHIVLGMGEAGKITRVFGALWGNELIFIPESDTEASAPGQISRSDFDEIINRIKK
ncbi:type I 3-dehydroquinate dehydratase [Candidatus Saccharibacteria bacterium]|nr:type I 3-dehydroquinate dehydratase [Candidatus Saccharibacteria bacterium]